MTVTPQPQQRYRGIAFVGNYLPRKCGIATFTHDLAEAVAGHTGADQPVIVCAMNDQPEGYDYPDRVRFELRQGYGVDYARAADFLNFGRLDVVSLQHEYGIFGGGAGANILTLLRDLQRPFVVTCHTVLKEPKVEQREVLSEIGARASKVVVMSERATTFLEELYGVTRSKIVHIPHGIHDVPFVDPSYFKDQFGVEGRRVLLTFGLLSRNKGIEHMIEALPAVVERHPRVSYLVLGATHPAVVRDEGESYRLSLQRRVRELGLEEHVLFHPRFVELDELLEYIGAADIFVTPYLNMDQITSGALSYAMGTGKAVVSTPYWHAEELLADDRGLLVPTADSAALSQAINSLLDDEVALAAMRKRAYLYCRSMAWSTVGRRYLDVFNEVRCRAPLDFPVATAVRRPIAPSNLPQPKLDHLERLGDDTGLAHRVRHTVPDWRHGYWLDDAATGLVVAAKYNEVFENAAAVRLSERYLALIQLLVSNPGGPAERLEYSRQPAGQASEEALGKAMWAVGYAVLHGRELFAEGASDLFTELVPSIELSSPRACAYAVLGAANYQVRFSGASAVRRYMSAACGRVADATENEDWADQWGGVDLGVAPQALAVASTHLQKPSYLDKAQALARTLRERTHEGTLFLSATANTHEEETPTAAASFIEGLGALFAATEDADLLPPIRSAADWFLGANRHNVPLYDFTTGGCRDGVTASGPKRNQGTESTLSCLLALLTLHGLAGRDRVRSERPSAPPHGPSRSC
jgi:glycosyltransferase involved in cell wall biosynthesis